MTVNLSGMKEKGTKTGSDLMVADIPELADMKLLPRKCLSKCMAIFDPLGLSSPLTIRYKLE